jgi:hypothetical protein
MTASETPDVPGRGVDAFRKHLETDLDAHILSVQKRDFPNFLYVAIPDSLRLQGEAKDDLEKLLENLRLVRLEKESPTSDWQEVFDHLIRTTRTRWIDLSSVICLFSRSKFEDLFAATFVNSDPGKLASAWGTYANFCSESLRWIRKQMAAEPDKVPQAVHHSTQNIDTRLDLAQKISVAVDQICSFLVSHAKLDRAKILKVAREASNDGSTEMWRVFGWFFLFNAYRFELASDEILREYESRQVAAHRHARMLDQLRNFNKEFVCTFQQIFVEAGTLTNLALKLRPFVAVAKSGESFLNGLVRDLLLEEFDVQIESNEWKTSCSHSLKRLAGMYHRVLDELVQRPCFRSVHNLARDQETLSVLVWQSGRSGAYTAHCLNYDLLTSGDSLEGAVKKLNDLVTAVLRLKTNAGELGLPIAPYEFWERFEKAENCLPSCEPGFTFLDIRSQSLHSHAAIQT